MILNNVKEDSSIDAVFEVIHEVKNSIAVCRGYLDIIDYDRECDMDKYISIMKKEIGRSMDIIGNFMLFGKFTVCKKNMDINELLCSLCCDIGVFITNMNVLFEYDILDDSIYVDGDCDKLKQVFINLIKNSIESIDKSDGIIKLYGYKKQGYYHVVISDNGCGIDEDSIEKIMLGGFTTKFDGNGIGIKFCKKVILEHNGSIEYKSILGSGTKVIVKLPIVMI